MYRIISTTCSLDSPHTRLLAYASTAKMHPFAHLEITETVTCVSTTHLDSGVNVKDTSDR